MPEMALSAQTGNQRLPYADLDIDVVRRFVQARAHATSVRAVAREIGIRHQSLEKFLDGSRPFARNRALICAWYLRQDPEERRAVPGAQASQPADDLSSHLEALLGDLDGPARREALMRVTKAISDAYVRMGVRPPAWLTARR